MASTEDGGPRRVGRFSTFTGHTHLILHITERLLSGQPLTALKWEELKVIRLTCLTVLNRGLEILLIRETLHNTGVSDNVVLNRKIRPLYWQRWYRYLRTQRPDLPLLQLFDEHRASRAYERLVAADAFRGLVTGFIRQETGLLITPPPDLLRDGNFLFSLGTVAHHRWFRLARFFTAQWGTEAAEPAVRVICQRLWFFHLIAADKLRVSPTAFREQQTGHEAGLFQFLIEDYRTFTGTLSRSPPPLPWPPHPSLRELLAPPRVFEHTPEAD
ncbi:T79 [Tupaiid betaherpesvirus 1]|uniref:T79 n=1 Tax=Tupaiid herpesvirus 1 (strain 1) TaxID=10397 RepID=Q91TL6_TUHV1|nr:T79 [Tupaiid betaherpesvirus 1]AAK57125.1 T79 [Tupaiid betaherpesvirus 1]